jgi:hypothetical protein
MADLTDATVLTRATGAVQATVDGDLVLMSPADFHYFGADGTGPVIWDLIDGVRTWGEILQALGERFDGDPAVIRAESAQFVDALRAAGLLAP